MTAGSDSVQTTEGGAAERTPPAPAGTPLQKMTDRIADEARGFAEDRKSEGAARIGGVAQAIHSAADQIQRELPQAADYIHDAASRLQEASSMVRERSLEDLVGMVDDFARRQPAAFFGGSVLAGFLLSRFLKSSNTRRPASMDSGSDFGGSSH